MTRMRRETFGRGPDDVVALRRRPRTESGTGRGIPAPPGVIVCPRRFVESAGKNYRAASIAARIARVWSGVLPQHEPTIAAPALSAAGTPAAISAGGCL